MRVQGLVFAGVGTADPAGAARFVADALGVDDGRRFELLDQKR